MRWAILGALAGLLLLGLVVPALGIHGVEPASDPVLPQRGFDHGLWDQVLSRHVRDGAVDYAALAAAPELLYSYAALLAAAGPENEPRRFENRSEQLAYYLNAYNALAMLGVVAHWPIRSVHDVRGWVEPTPGFGFFWAQRFRLEGGTTSLYALEEKIRGWGDPRIHAALNCASKSCPPLFGRAFTGQTLEADLDALTRAWVGRVQIDESVQLSPIFDWYATDFEAGARKLGGQTTLDWVRHYSLEPDRLVGKPIRFSTYDWRLNGLLE